MKFFEAKQVQEVVGTEYPDRQWDINKDGRLFMKHDMLSAIDGKESFTLDFKFSYQFERDLPAEAPTSSGETFKFLNFSTYMDCITGLQLREFAEFDCTNRSQDEGVPIHIHNAYSNELILGPTKAAYPLFRKTLSQDYQKHDLALEYRCGGRWLARSSKGPNLTPLDIKFMEVSPATCEPLSEEDREKLDRYKRSEEYQSRSELGWGRLQFTLFSMMVSGSFLAGFSVKTFYTGVVLIAGSSIRPAFLYGTWRGWVYECTHPDAIIKLIEAVYMRRHEEDLTGEEEAYRMLQEIVRQPELFKAITGSTLKGTCDPHLDRLPEQDRRKMEQLETLARKGFEVEQLKMNILNRHGGQDALAVGE